MLNRHVLIALFAATAIVGAAACSGNGNPTSPSATAGSGLGASSGGTGGAGATGAGGSGGSGGSGGGSTGGGSGVGRLAVNMTDSPFSDAMAVLVTFSEVSVHHTGSGWETLPFADGGGSRTCDLKRLEGPVDILGVGSLPAGKYTQIRLTVASASIHFDNASAGDICAPTIAAPDGLQGTVEVPSGVVKLNRGFTVPEGGQTTITLDFDGDKSIKQKGGPKTDKGNGSDTSGQGGSKGCNGKGKKPGCEDTPPGEDPDDGGIVTEDAGTFMMKPVISVASVVEDSSPTEATSGND